MFAFLVFLKHYLVAQCSGQFTDNRNIPSITRSGSMKRNLYQLPLSIFKIVIRNSIDLQIDWIPRSFNDHADAISRIIDFDDWGVYLEVFIILITFGVPIMWTALPISIAHVYQVLFLLLEPRRRGCRCFLS